MKLIISLLTLFLMASCVSSPESFVAKIENAHKKTLFLSKNAIEFDFHLKFGGKTRIAAKMTMLTNSSKSRIDYNDGRTIIQNGDKVYYSQEFKNKGAVRFDAFTWSYFFLFPYKLSDNGTKWNDFPTKDLNNKKYLVEKLTFENGIGDAPDDWYVVYADIEKHLIETAAYIVSFGKGKKKAEEDPHAMKYNSYQDVEGVPIATKWSFWGWTEEKGLTDKKIGEASLENIKFIKTNEVSFAPSDKLILFKK